MQIAIVSDTHDNTPAIVWIIEYLNEKGIKTCLHAGDMINPGILRRFIEHYDGHLHFVFGNNDGEQLLLERRAGGAENATCHGDHMELELAGRKIFMQHYSAVSQPVAKSGEYDIAIGGHDHLYRVEEYERSGKKSLFVNPGNTVTKDKWLPQEPDEESSIVLLDLATLAYERVMLPKNL